LHCKDCGTGLCQSEACSVYENADKPFGVYKHDDKLLCINCYNHIVLGGKPKTMVRKEQFILAELQRQMPELEDFFVLWDCPIKGGCSNRRPDMLYDFGIAYLVIEIDEDAHRYEDESCRNKRMCEIYQDLEHSPIVFVRINPDKCETRELSMFTLTQKTRKFKCNEEEFEYRMRELYRCVKEFYDSVVEANVVPEKSFDVINLFM
jgi:hypothetical protein